MSQCSFSMRNSHHATSFIAVRTFPVSTTCRHPCLHCLWYYVHSDCFLWKAIAEPPALRHSVSQGGLVIALEKSTRPNQRLYVYRAERKLQYGYIPITEPAQASFVYSLRPTSPVADRFSSTLTTDEWRDLANWWADWCRQGPKELPSKTTQTAYRIALRCGSLSGSLFVVAPETVPPAIQAILRRATNNAYS